MKAKLFHSVVFAVVGAAVFASTLAAQSFLGGVRGLVQDAGGAVVANAKVSLVNEGTQIARSAVTSSGGEYVFSQADPATYTVTVESPGFKKLSKSGIILGTAQTITVDLKLEVGEITSSVQVTEEVPLIEVSNASGGQVLDSQKMTDLPNLGRNPFLLAKLAANVVAAGDPRFNRFQDQSGSSAISIAGGPIRGNNYLIDGVPVTDSINRAVIIPSIEATQEMKLQAGTYDATMGRTGGGVFNTLLRSGSNQYHGSLMGYTRQTSWLANSFFRNATGAPRPDTPFNTWGASFGGAIRVPKVYDGRNKTFFWVATESYRQKSPLTDQYALPSTLEARGDYSRSTAIIYNPLSSRPCTAADACPGNVTQVRTPFPGNIIPQSLINPVGAAIMGYIPTVAPGGRTGAINFTGNDTLTDRADEYTSKLDHTLMSWWKVSASYLHYKSREPGGNSLGTLPGGSGNGPYLLFRKADATAVNNTITLNPTTIMVVRYGFNRFPNQTAGISLGFNPATLGLPASFNNATQAKYFPTITLLNNTLSSVSPSITFYSSRNFSASVSKFVGKHNMSTGFDYRVIHTDYTNLANSGGNFSFNGVFSRQYPSQTNGTGSDFADLLLGYPSAGQVNTSTKLFAFVKYYSGYFQDDIRITPKLTINAGLRYEYETGVGEANNRIVVGFDQRAVNPIAANVTGVVPYGVLQYAGQSSAPKACCAPPKTKFGPRIGFAFQATPKTTVRGGWGIFYAPTIFNNDATIAPGYNQVTPYVASNDGNVTPANSLSNPFPGGVLQPVGNTLGALTAIGSTFSFLDQGRTAGLVHQFSFDIQQQLPFGVAFEIGYVGSRSSRLQPSPTGAGNMNINQLPMSYLSRGAALNTAVPNPFFGRGGAGVIGNATVAQAQLLLPFPQYSTIGMVTNPSSAQYDSMIMKVQKKTTKGLTLLSTFTWSKNQDNAFGSGVSNAFNTFSGSNPPSQPQNYYNLDAEWALAASHTPLRLTSAVTYELPFGKGKSMLNSSKMLDYVVGGWSINGTAIYQAGFPLFVFQQNLNGIIGTGAQRPNATGISPATSGSVNDRLNAYINKDAFSQAPAFTFGNISRSLSTLGPGMRNYDLSIFKNFKITEAFSGQFRAEALNAFNTPVFANPNTQFGTTSFGKITYQSNLPRQIQLGVRFFF